MEPTQRRQLHSCDPCRKGKRGCDAPVWDPPKIEGLPDANITLFYRKLAKTADLTLVPIVNAGIRIARSTGLPQNVPMPKRAERRFEKRHAPLLQLHRMFPISSLLPSRMVQSWTKYCALLILTLPI